MRRVMSIGNVTAGLMWAPLTSAKHQMMVATARPDVRDNWTMVGGASCQPVLDPQQKKISNMVPRASAVTARQKRGLCMSSVQPAIPQSTKRPQRGSWSSAMFLARYKVANSAFYPTSVVPTLLLALARGLVYANTSSQSAQHVPLSGLIMNASGTE